jgi:hypothetical protein
MKHGHDTKSDGTDSYWLVEHSGWTGGGWREDDPTAEEAMEALASLDNLDYERALASLHRSGEAGLEKLQTALQLGNVATAPTTAED